MEDSLNFRAFLMHNSELVTGNFVSILVDMGPIKQKSSSSKIVIN